MIVVGSDSGITGDRDDNYTLHCIVCTNIIIVALVNILAVM